MMSKIPIVLLIVAENSNAPATLAAEPRLKGRCVLHRLTSLKNFDAFYNAHQDDAMPIIVIDFGAAQESSLQGDPQQGQRLMEEAHRLGLTNGERRQIIGISAHEMWRTQLVGLGCDEATTEDHLGDIIAHKLGA